jgi:integral membrane protein (TIGR00529 family)
MAAQLREGSVERDIVALALSVVLIIALVRFRLDLGIAMFVGAVSMAFVSGRAVAWTGVEVWRAVIAKDSLLLFGRIATILMLGALAGRLGYLDHVVWGLKRMIRDNRIVVALVPAFGGLLPMPGGTMLTAPMVENALKSTDVRPEDRFFIAYWFRHVWEYVWPLYPAIILVALLIDRPVADIARTTYPLTLAAITGGVLLVLRRAPVGRNETSPEGRKEAWPVLAKGTLPFAIVIIGALVFKFEVMLVVLAVVVFLAVFEKAHVRDVLAALRKGTEFQIITLVFGVSAYKHLLIVTGIREALPEFFLQMQVPELLVIIAAPMLIGLVTGATVAFVAVTFPLLLPIMTMDGGSVDMELVMLAFASGFVGCLLSPVHLCLVLSREYFGAGLGGIYRLLIPATLVIMGVAVAIVLL